jgi:hypothetical protein
MESVLGQRACVFTSLFGRYEDLLEQPIAAESGIDLICFTDDPNLKSDSWQLRLVPPVLTTDAPRSARYPKICAHRFLPEYDVSLYIDNSVLLTRRPEDIIEALLPPAAGLAAVEHSFRETVLDEFEQVKRARREAAWVCDEQLDHYRRSIPEVLGMKPLIGGVLVRRHMRPDVVAAMERWWIHVLRFSRRDQLSFQAALHEAGLTPTTWALDVRDSGSWVWPASTGRDPAGEGTSPARTVFPADLDEAADRDARIAELEAQVLSERTEHGHTMRRIDDLEAERRALSDRCADLDAAHESLIRDIEALRSSTSWRITAGLRAAGRWLRRRGRHAG